MDKSDYTRIQQLLKMYKNGKIDYDCLSRQLLGSLSLFMPDTPCKVDLPENINFIIDPIDDVPPTLCLYQTKSNGLH